MDGFAELTARSLASAYVLYAFALLVTSLLGAHLVVLGVLAWRAYRQPQYPWGPRNALALQVFYGLANPLFYLFVFHGGGPSRGWTLFDVWMHAAAWTLLVAIWGSRLLLPRELETSPLAVLRLRRLCTLGLICLTIFGANDLIRLVASTVRTSGPALPFVPRGLWAAIALAPLYVIPFLLLNRYRLRLADHAGRADFLLMSRGASSRLAVALGALAVVTVAASMFRPGDATARARVERIAPAIQEAAARYHVDAKLIAAIVYVSEREVGPFRDQLERFTTTMFLFDTSGELALGKWFDLSIGAAQIKPVTALTALELCRASGRPWSIALAHLREVPALGAEWTAHPRRLAACEPPSTPVPEDKRMLVHSLQQDETNVAFAALILALYQSQWRDANPAWDISARPEILATLYQIGFARSRPHGAPRSSDFGKRVAEVSHAPWVQQRFGSGGQLAAVDLAARQVASQ